MEVFGRLRCTWSLMASTEWNGVLRARFLLADMMANAVSGVL